MQPGVNLPPKPATPDLLKASVATPVSTTPKGDKGSAAEKAAELRAKLIAMRPTSGTPVREKSETAKPTTSAMKEPALTAAAPTTLERRDSITDVDGLLAEGRAAAEAKAKLQNGDRGSHNDKPGQAAKLSNNRQEHTTTATAPTNKQAKTAQDGKKQEDETAKNKMQRARSLMDSPELGEIREESDVESVLPLSRNSNEKSEPKLDKKTNGPTSAAISMAPNEPRPKPVEAASRNARQPRPRTPPNAGKEPERVTSLRHDKPKQANKSVAPVEERREDLSKRSRDRTTYETINTTENRVSRPRQSAESNLPAHDRVVDSQSTRETTQQRYNTNEKAGSAAAAYSNYFDDLDEWLEITGYHNRSYRQSALKRHRALRDLEIQRARIEQEAEVELQNASYLLPTQPVKTLENMRSSSVLAMPPPPLPLSSAPKLTTDTTPGDQNSGDSSRYKNASSTKRPLSSDSKETNGQERAEKLIKVDSSGQASKRDDQQEKLMSSPKATRSEHLPSFR